MSRTALMGEKCQNKFSTPPEWLERPNVQSFVMTVRRFLLLFWKVLLIPLEQGGHILRHKIDFASNLACFSRPDATESEV